jgi:AcrR family transcriptional regulator
MPDPVKRNRPYDSSRRQEQARRTRAAILAAARRTFLAKGYTATTIASVASAAEVSVDTIYKQFRGKAGLLKAVYDVAIVGDDEPVPFIEREDVRRWSADPDPVRVIREYCALFAVTAPRVMPMVLLVGSAGVDPEAQQVWAGIRTERLGGMALFAADLHRRGLLRPGMGADEARDVLWVFTAPELYEMLVLARGWSLDRYGDFLAEALIAALLAR